jgi:hypothetical protein
MERDARMMKMMYERASTTLNSLQVLLPYIVTKKNEHRNYAVRKVRLIRNFMRTETASSSGEATTGGSGGISPG